MENNILDLFHHIHHNDSSHEVHHCGGKHIELDYTIKHCPCGKHSIDKEIAMGHATGADLEPIAVKVKFSEKCPVGGWHLESGERQSPLTKKQRAR